MILENGGYRTDLLDVGTSQRNVREPFQSDLFRMTGTTDNCYIFCWNLVILREVIRNQHILIRYDTLDRRDDKLIFQRGLHLLQMLFQERGRRSEDQGIRVLDRLVDIGIEVYLVRVEFHGGEVTRVVSQLLELLDTIGPTHVPVDTILS